MMMNTHRWSGLWPTDEYPPDGAIVSYLKGDIELRSMIVSCWCGVEPAFTLENGDTIHPGLDPFEVVS